MRPGFPSRLDPSVTELRRRVDRAHGGPVESHPPVGTRVDVALSVVNEAEEGPTASSSFESPISPMDRNISAVSDSKHEFPSTSVGSSSMGAPQFSRMMSGPAVVWPAWVGAVAGLLDEEPLWTQPLPLTGIATAATNQLSIVDGDEEEGGQPDGGEGAEDEVEGSEMVLHGSNGEASAREKDWPEGTTSGSTNGPGIDPTPLLYPIEGLLLSLLFSSSSESGFEHSQHHRRDVSLAVATTQAIAAMPLMRRRDYLTCAVNCEISSISFPKVKLTTVAEFLRSGFVADAPEVWTVLGEGGWVPPPRRLLSLQPILYQDWSLYYYMNGVLKGLQRDIFRMCVDRCPAILRCPLAADRWVGEAAKVLAQDVTFFQAFLPALLLQLKATGAISMSVPIAETLIRGKQLELVTPYFDRLFMDQQHPVLQPQLLSMYCAAITCGNLEFLQYMDRMLPFSTKRSLLRERSYQFEKSLKFVRDPSILRHIAEQHKELDWQSIGTAFHMMASALRHPTTDALRFMIEELKFSPFAVDFDGGNLWHRLAGGTKAQQAPPQTLAYLQSLGVDPLAENHGGWTPLMTAVSYGPFSLVRYLIEVIGCPIEASDSFGQSILEMAVSTFDRESSLQMFQYLHEKTRCSLSTVSERSGYSIVGCAVIKNSQPLVHYCAWAERLDLGNLVVDSMGRTAWELAADFHSFHVSAYLEAWTLSDYDASPPLHK
jgi:hypothetical protein